MDNFEKKKIFLRVVK